MLCVFVCVRIRGGDEEKRKEGNEERRAKDVARVSSLRHQSFHHVKAHMHVCVCVCVFVCVCVCVRVFRDVSKIKKEEKKRKGKKQ